MEGCDIQSLLALYSAEVLEDTPRIGCDEMHEQLMQARELRGASRAAMYPTEIVPMVGSMQGDRDAARLFVGGLPYESSDEDLASLASQLVFSAVPCELLECRVLPGRGCGYLRYTTWEAAEEAFNALQGRQVEGWTQVLRVQWATPRNMSSGMPAEAMLGMPVKQVPRAPLPGEMMPKDEAHADPLSYGTREDVERQGLEPTRLFVGQIARDADATTHLRPLFESFGQISEFRWVQDKGILYVTYASFEEAQSAMQALRNQPIPAVSKCLNVKFSQRRF